MTPTELRRKQFSRGISPNDALKSDHYLERTYETWDPTEGTVYSCTLNLAAHLQELKWQVVIESPVRGVKRSYRVPIFAFRDDSRFILKVVTDARKLNSAGIKMGEIATSLNNSLPSAVHNDPLFVPAVYGTFANYDLRRITKDSFKIFLEPDLNNGIFN